MTAADGKEDKETDKRRRWVSSASRHRSKYYHLSKLSRRRSGVNALLRRPRKNKTKHHLLRGKGGRAGKGRKSSSRNKQQTALSANIITAIARPPACASIEKHIKASAHAHVCHRRRARQEKEGRRRRRPRGGLGMNAEGEGETSKEMAAKTSRPSSL